MCWRLQLKESGIMITKLYHGTDQKGLVVNRMDIRREFCSLIIFLCIVDIPQQLRYYFKALRPHSLTERATINDVGLINYRIRTDAVRVTLDSFFVVFLKCFTCTEHTKSSSGVNQRALSMYRYDSLAMASKRL